MTRLMLLATVSGLFAKVANKFILWLFSSGYRDSITNAVLPSIATRAQYHVYCPRVVTCMQQTSRVYRKYDQ